MSYWKCNVEDVVKPVTIDGGPAFPHHVYKYETSMSKHGVYDGMSLRDYFAAKAMQAIITKLPTIDQKAQYGITASDKVKYNEDIASSAYWLADAMLKAREQ